ncbi:MAG TPA: carbohydrate ABC transporter permease [Chthoniobacteraceae bacterium]|nr:carbohydrate ABC transporter permease [Chthoniobacteraceae bacterium]
MKARLLAALIWLVVLWCLAPFVWQIVTSLKTEAEIAHIPTVYLPGEPTLHHYAVLFERKPFARYLWNSFVISSAATLVCLAVSALAAYSFARLRVRGAKWIRLVLVAIAFFPPIIFFFPLYEMVRATHTANTPLALIIPYATFNLPFAILVLSAFFRTISSEIEDAAKVDGFSPIQILLKIILPLSAPALATTGILVFIFCWNEFLLALTFMTCDTARTVTAGIASLSGGTPYELPWGAISASVVLSTLPLVALVMIFQRRIVQGLTAGATKG